MDLFETLNQLKDSMDVQIIIKTKQPEDPSKLISAQQNLALMKALTTLMEKMTPEDITKIVGVFFKLGRIDEPIPEHMKEKLASLATASASSTKSVDTNGSPANQVEIPAAKPRSEI